MKILALDPSGSFKYGSGTTGWTVMETENFVIEKLGSIKAKNYSTREMYFAEHIRLLKEENVDVVVIEDFILYKSTASTMVNQELETSELIGYIEGKANELGIKVVRQTAQSIKTILKRRNVLLSIINSFKYQIQFKTSKSDREQWYYKNTRISTHILDSIRHAILFANNQRREK